MLLNSGWAFTSSKNLYAECTNKGLIFNVVSSAEIMSSKYFAGKVFPVFLLCYTQKGGQNNLRSRYIDNATQTVFTWLLSMD